MCNNYLTYLNCDNYGPQMILICCSNTIFQFWYNQKFCDEMPMNHNYSVIEYCVFCLLKK